MSRALVVLVTVLAVVAITVFAFAVCRAQRACEAAGGRVEQYDCMIIYTPMSCGTDCSILVPNETCSWRCVGVPAEKGNP